MANVAFATKWNKSVYVEALKWLKLKNKIKTIHKYKNAHNKTTKIKIKTKNVHITELLLLNVFVFKAMSAPRTKWITGVIQLKSHIKHLRWILKYIQLINTSVKHIA